MNDEYVEGNEEGYDGSEGSWPNTGAGQKVVGAGHVTPFAAQNLPVAHLHWCCPTGHCRGFLIASWQVLPQPFEQHFSFVGQEESELHATIQDPKPPLVTAGHVPLCLSVRIAPRGHLEFLVKQAAPVGRQ